MDLKTLRAMKKETQWSLRNKTGIHQSKLSLIERGYIAPVKGEKEKIAKALNTSVDQITWPMEGHDAKIK